MIDNLFDNLIRDKIANYPSAVPDGLWEKIMAEKDREPKPIIWWRKYLSALILTGIILLVSGVYYTISSIKNNSIGLNSTQQISSINSDTAISRRNNASNIVSVQLDSLNKTGIENIASSSKNNQSPFNENNSGFFKNKKYMDELEKRLTNSTSQNNLLDSQQLFNVNEMPNDNMNEVADRKYTNLNLSIINTHQLYNQNGIRGFPLNLKNILGIGRNDCPSAEGYREPPQWYWEAYLSPDYSTKTLYNNGLSQAYIKAIDSSETMHVGFSAGIRLTKIMHDHFVVRAGLQYSQINEHLAKVIENDTVLTTVVKTRTIIRPQGDTTIYDTTTLMQVGSKSVKNNNRYRNISIPITVGYQFGNADSKLKVGVNGGVMVNIASWFNGVALDTTYKVVNADSKGSTGFYKTNNVGLSLLGSVNMLYNLNERTDIFAEPYFRYNFLNTNSSAGFSQKLNTFGIQFGLRFKISGKQHY